MQLLHINDTFSTGLSVNFAMQPIIGVPTMRPYGYELLYRGPRPVHWPLVDRVLLNYLAGNTRPRPALFINLSNETVLTEDLTKYVHAGARSNTYFELTEAVSDLYEYREVSRRVNAFTAEGIRFAIDDFGGGLDGLQRHAALHEIAFVKLDRLFMQLAKTNATTRRIVEMLVKEWTTANTSTIAEGIETRDDLEFAMRLGVQMFQGFFVDALLRSPTSTSQPIQARDIIR